MIKFVCHCEIEFQSVLHFNEVQAKIDKIVLLITPVWLPIVVNIYNFYPKLSVYDKETM